MDKKEHIIIKNLFENEEYSKKISPHLSVNFFETINLSGRIIIDKYIKFVEKYKTNPNYEEVFLSLTDDPKVKDTTLEDLQSIKDSEIEKMNLDYLVDMTESHYQITEASEIPEVMAKAFYIARSGRPGPVLIDITKNAQFETFDFDYEKCTSIRSYKAVPDIDKSQLLQAAELINAAKKPMIIFGQELF